MTRRLSTVALPAGCLLAVFGLWGVDGVTWIRAKHAPVAAIAEPPNLVWTGVVLALALVLTAICVHGWLRRRGPEFRGYRLAPILLVTALFVELFVFGEQRIPVPSNQRLEVALKLFAQLASEQIHDGQVPRDPAVLEKLVEQLGTPPYLHYGRSPGPYRLQVRENCDGPVRDAPGSELGTLLYCIARDGKTGWVSAVALPAETSFGPPALYSRGGIVQWAEVATLKSDSGPQH